MVEFANLKAAVSTYLFLTLRSYFICFQSRFLHRNTFLYHSLTSKSHITCWVWLLLRMAPVIDFPAPGLSRWPQLKILVILHSPDLCADGNQRTEGLEPPHCTALSGSSGPLLWYCQCTLLLWFPHHGVWFSSKVQVCQSAGIWAQVLWSLSAHLQDPASYNPPTCVFHMYIIQTVQTVLWLLFINNRWKMIQHNFYIQQM